MSQERVFSCAFGCGFPLCERRPFPERFPLPLPLSLPLLPDREDREDLRLVLELGRRWLDERGLDALRGLEALREP